MIYKNTRILLHTINLNLEKLIIFTTISSEKSVAYMQLEQLIEQNRTNHYTMLVIVDNNHKSSRIIDALAKEGWSSYDVEENILRMTEDIPENKVKLRIGDKIKEWFNELPDKIILYNTTILYSPDLGRLNPVGAFKYRARDKECIVILEGSVSGNRIQYSEYGKDDHVGIDVSELIHVKMEDIDG